MEEEQKQQSNKKGFIIAAISIVLVACIIGLSIYFYISYMRKNKYAAIQQIAYSLSTSQSTEDTKKQVVIPINFEELKNKNSDIYAWIKIDDTVIDYPILQSTSDPEDYYLDHTVDRKKGLPGSIYTRMTAAKDFSNVNTLVYGHNMKDGTMFKALHKYEDRSFFDAHPYITVYTETQELKYEIFAAVTYSDVLIPANYDFSTEQGLMAFVDSLKKNKHSKDQIKDSVDIKPTDKLITLSTCIANRPNNRYIVVGVLKNEA